MSQTMLEVKEVSKHFPSKKNTFEGHHALRNITLSIDQGDVYGIVGMSGAGKSTLMRCLIGLEKPSTGSIFFHGKNIAAMSDRALREYRKNIGMVFQHFNLLPSRTVFENVAFPMEIHGASKDAIQKRVDELLQLVGLKHKKNVYPARLSGGEKQRVGIARALANNPEILLCDEATSALDPKTMRSILELLVQLNKDLGLTIIVITHQLEVIKQVCTKVAVLSHGELEEEGSVEDVFSAPKSQVTRQLLYGQLPALPEQILHPDQPGKKIYRLSFKGNQAKEPVISRLLKRFDVEVNILQANLDSFQKTVVGILLVEISGSEAERQNALSYLKENLVQYEEIT